MIKLTTKNLVGVYKAILANPPGPNVRANIYIGEDDGSQPLGLPGEPQFFSRDRKGDTWYLVIWQERK